MRGRFLALALVPAVLTLNACVSGFPANGMNNANLQAVDFSRVGQMKRGESCATTILGLFTNGSSLISDAAKAGGLKKVELVEYRGSANPLFSKQCAIVFGQ